MSGSPREKAAGEAQRTQADLSSQLSGVALPELQSVISKITGQLAGGPQAIAPMVHEQFAPVRAGLDEDFNRAAIGAPALMRQRAKQSGEMFTNTQLDDATRMAANTVEVDRQAAIRRLGYREAQAGQDQWNQLIQLLGGASGAALNLGAGASGNQMRAIGGLSDTSPWSGAMGGAATGASLGASTGNPYGAIAGGIVGGVGGYFGSG